MPKKMNKAVPPATERGKRMESYRKESYGKLHQDFRKALLQKFPFCQCTGCGEKCCNNKSFSEQANHLTYPATKLEDYQALCTRCHMIITSQEHK